MSRTTQNSAPIQTSSSSDSQRPQRIVLIASSDAVGPALLGGLIETLGYGVGFQRPGERMADALRRQHPGLVLIDASDPEVSAETLGHARMLGVQIMIFGASDAVERARAMFGDQPLDALVMPLQIEAVRAALQKFLADS